MNLNSATQIQAKSMEDKYIPYPRKIKGSVFISVKIQGPNGCTVLHYPESINGT